MDKVLSFFRVFDIAFVAPGAVLFAALYSRYERHTDALGSTFSAKDIVFILMAIGATYILGLFVHAIQRILSELFFWLGKFTKKSAQPSSELSWYQYLDDENRRELALYFWYLRATYRNLAVALPLGAIIFDISAHFPKWPLWILILCTLTVSGILVFSSYEYDRSLDKAMETTER